MLLALVPLAHLTLLPRGRWIGDEFAVLVSFRESGPRALVHMLAWVPRLFSDPLLYAYGLVVRVNHRPFVGAVLGLLWAAVAVACVGPVARRPAFWAVALATLAMLWVGHPLGEAFLWVAAALAYLPALAAVAWLFWSLALGGRPVAAGAALALAAGSHEMGAFFALAFAPLAWVAARGSRPRWVLPGFGGAIFVVLLLALGSRTGSPEGLVDGGPYLHHAAASLAEAAPVFWREVVGRAPSLLLLVLGVRWAWPGPRPWRRLAAFAVALLAASYGSVAAALFEFGEVCCERHETLRACFVVLAAVATGVATAGRLRPLAGCAALVLAVAVPGAERAPKLLAEWRLVPGTHRAVDRTWTTGLAPDSDAMVLALAPVGPLVAGTAFQPGRYVFGTPGLAWQYTGVLAFFHKRVLNVTAPETAPAP